MNIIEFLMNNIYFVIIILFVLSRIFSKAGSQNKPTQMPDFGGGGQVRQSNPQASNMDHSQPDRSDAQAEQRARRELERRAEQHTMHEPSGNALYASQAAAADERPARRPSAGRTGAASVSDRSVSAQQPNRQVSATAEDLRRAVIWSEVLGQPRAKRPFRK